MQSVSGDGDINGDGLDDLIAASRGGLAKVYTVAGLLEIPASRVDRPEGDTIGYLLGDRLVDRDDDARKGIAIRFAQGSGVWQYSVDGGAQFRDMGVVDASHALLLRDVDRIRYVSDQNTSADATLVVVGWDQASGTAGAKEDTSIRGGTTGLSWAAATVIVAGPASQTPGPDRPPLFSDIPLPGDANEDFKIDQLDLVQVQVAAKYLTGEPATWAEGDWNGNGLFDPLDIVAALQTGNYLQGPYGVSGESYPSQGPSCQQHHPC